MQIDFKKLQIDIIAIIGFAILSLAYCYPQMSGKKLNAHDNISWMGMAREGMAYHDSTGKEVLWSNSMFGGMPTYTTYVGTSSTNYVGYVQNFLQVVGKPAYFFFIAMLCFYVLMRVMGVNKWLSIVGSIAYAFSSYNAIIIGVGHDTKMLTIGYLPAALAGFYLIYREKWLTGAAVLGIAMALIFTNVHFQVIYYSFIMFACFVVGMLFVAIKQGRIKQFFISVLISGVIVGIGAGPCTSSILTTQEYAKETMRGGASELSGHDKKTNGGLDKEYAFRWSNGIGETFCIMVPFLYGGSGGEAVGTSSNTYERLTSIGVPDEQAEAFCQQLPMYWGPQPFLSGPVYFGAVICFLFVLGLMVVKSPHRWWILAACCISILMSWGRHFPAINYFLFDTLPMLNKFRTPSMWLVIAQFLFPVLGILALNEVINATKKEEILKSVKTAVIITAGLCLLLGIGGRMLFDFRSDRDERTEQQFASMFGGGERGAEPAKQIMKAIQDDRAGMATKSGLMSAFYILLAGGLIWAYAKGKVKAPMLVGGIGLLVAIDLIPVAHNYLNEQNYVDASEYESVFEPRAVDRQILMDKDPYYRVLDITKDTYNDAVQAYFHKCIGGYHPAKMEMYQDLIDRQLSRGFNKEVLNMLNTKYIIVPGQKGEPGVIPNPEACGNAWFVNEVKWANTADEEMDGLTAPNIGDTTIVPNAFNPRQTAVIRTTFKNDMGNYAFGKDSAAYVKLDKYGLDDISFVSGNSQNGLAVFSDIYYSKGWKAYVDGKETPIMKANYVLRAIKIPAGNHKIEFRFRPESFYTGQKVAMVSSILLILLALGALYPLFKKPAQQ